MSATARRDGPTSPPARAPLTPASRNGTTDTGTAPQTGGWWFAAAFIPLQICVAASAILVLHSLAGMAMPGCGAGSPCDLAAASKWGKVPGIGLPVSILGFAYFLAMLQAWFGAAVSRSVPMGLRWFARLGAAASVMFMFVAITQHMPCIYCLVTHGANLAFVAVLEATAIVTGAGSARRQSPLAAFAGVFVLALAALGGYWASARAEIEARNQQALSTSTAEMVAKGQADRQRAEHPDKGSPGAATPTAPGSNPNPGSTGATPATNPPTTPAPPASKPFTGRYVWGPEKAPIRIVVFSDFQCPDCRNIDSQVRALMKTRKDLSVSAKHFPMCPECNKYAPRLHDNACNAAYAAEAAGIVGGTDAFWKMHDWLFDRSGGFYNDTDLRAGAQAAGVDFAALRQAMNSEEAHRRVKDDIEEAWALGMWRTPMIFINGVEMKGWMVGQSVSKVVETLAASNPPAVGPENDHPPSAAEKLVADWRENPPIPIQPRATGRSWAQGPDSAPLRVVLYLDYQLPWSAEVDGVIRRELAKRPAGTWRYDVRFFPFSNECNPGVDPNQPGRQPLACLCVRAAIAAGMQGGSDAFWKMHDWLLANRERAGIGTIREAAASMGLNGDTLLATMSGPDVAQVIAGDLTAAKAAYVMGAPIVIINDRQVREWKTSNGEIMLGRMFEDAAAMK